MVYTEAFNRVGGTTSRCAHLSTQGTPGRTGSRKHRWQDRRALLSMWGTRTSQGTGGSKHRRLQVDQEMLGVWGLRPVFLQEQGRLGHSEVLFEAWHSVCCWAVCGLSTHGQSGRVWTWRHTALARFNVGLLVVAGDEGGAAHEPSSCSWTSLFFLPRRCGESSKAVFFRWRVVDLGLWVQIGTADGGKCFAVDTMLPMVEVVLGGECACLDARLCGHTPHAPFMTCSRRAAVEGKEGSN